MTVLRCREIPEVAGKQPSRIRADRGGTPQFATLVRSPSGEAPRSVTQLATSTPNAWKPILRILNTSMCVGGVRPPVLSPSLALL